MEGPRIGELAAAVRQIIDEWKPLIDRARKLAEKALAEAEKRQRM